MASSITRERPFVSSLISSQISSLKIVESRRRLFFGKDSSVSQVGIILVFVKESSSFQVVKLSHNMTSAQGPASADQYSGLVDNRCCFCLTLRTGAIITGIFNGFVNIAAFTA